MNVELPQTKMTVPQFLDWGARQSEGRYELVRGKIVAMSPERVRHNLAKGAVFRAFERAVADAGLDCTVFTDGVGIVIDGETCREPDACVQMGRVVDLDAMTIDEPIIVVEVISPSSVRTDQVDKVSEYFSVASVVHYLVVDPLQGVVRHWQRGDGGAIESRILRDGELLLQPPGMRLAVADLVGERR